MNTIHESMVLMALEDIESNIYTLMERGYDDDRIRKEIEKLIQRAREDFHANQA